MTRLAVRARPAFRALHKRSFVALALIIVGTTCRDVPTGLSPNGNMANAGPNGLAITPALDTLLVTEQVILTARNSNGSNITKQASWVSSDTNVAKVVVTGIATARVTGRAPGSVTITATSQNKSGTATIVVRPVPVASVSVSPDSASLQIGDSTQYTAVPRDSAGGALSGRVVTWSVTDTTIATVSASGMAKTRARGTTQVRATVEGVVGSKPLFVRVPELTVASISTADSANAGDTLSIAYSILNSQDRPDADSVIVRVGLRNTTSGTVHAATRRAFARILGGATTHDTVRIAISSALPAGALTVVAYADCRDSSTAPSEIRLTSCLSAPGTAGSIPESSESNNSASAGVIVRGPDIVATALSAPDSIFTRTTINAVLAVNNTGSATAAGFGVSASLYDVTTSTTVVAASTTTAILGSRQSRDVTIPLAIPALLDPSHTYQVRAVADSSGEIGESIETNNSASRAAIVASNVARVEALPDSSLLVALNDTTVLSASAFDRGNAIVSGVSFAWTTLDPAIASVSGSTVRALAVGTARVVVTGEGRSDTARVYVIQTPASVVASHDTVTLGALGETRQLSAVVRDRNANAIPGAAIGWSSANAAVATVSETGLVTAAALGTANIVAVHGALADTVRFTVVQLPARVVALPDSSLLTYYTDSTFLTATVYDNNSNVIPGASVSWASLDEGVATVWPGGRVVAQTGDGTARIVATFGALKDTVLVYVAREVAFIQLAPDSTGATAIGAGLELTASVSDSGGGAITTAPVSWTSLDPTIVRIDSSGTLFSFFKGWGTTVATGRARIVATTAGVADTAIVDVIQRPMRVDIVQEFAQVSSIGDTVTFTAIAYDGNNNPIPGAVLTWSVLNGGQFAELVAPGTFVSRAHGSAVARVATENDLFTDIAGITVEQVATSVVAPDTIRITALGAGSGIGAEAFDARGNHVTHTAVGFTNLDPAIVNLEGQLLTATAVGTARIVASLHGATDTTIVIVTQTIASITLTPGSATTTAGGSFTVSADVRDENNQTVSSPIVTWSSLNTNIATINGTTTGQVIGVAEGVTAIIGAINGVADTVPVAVNPAGYTHRWLGAASSQWTNPANWAPGVPDSTSDTYIPAGTPNAPYIDVQSVTTRALKVESGVNVTGIQYAYIDSYGSVDNAGFVIGVVMQGVGGTVRGNFEGLGVNAAHVVLAGRTTATRGVGVGSDDGTGPIFGTTLDINGHTLVAGAMGAGYGRLVQDDAADSVIVAGSINWTKPNGGSMRSLVSAGVLLVGGDFDVHNSDSAFVSTGTHKVVFTGSGNHNLWNRDTLTAWNDVEVSGTLTLRHTQGVKGRLVLNAGSHVTASDPNHFLIMHTSLPEGPGTYDLQLIKLVGTATLAANVTQPSMWLSIENGGELRLNGRKVDIGRIMTYGGGVTMTSATDTLLARESAQLHGPNTLTAGTLVLPGSFDVGGPSTHPGFTWNVGGSHKTVFSGTMPQTPSFADTAAVTFQNVDVTNTQGVAFNSFIRVGGLLKLVNGGRVTAPSGQLAYLNQLPDLANGTYEVQVSLITGNVTATANRAIPGSLFIQSGGSLRLAGHRLLVESFGTYDGTLTMDNAADTLATGYAQFYGVSNLSAGVIEVRGDMNVSFAPPPFVTSWNLSGSHKIVFAGSQPQQFSFSDTTVANLLNVEVRNTQGVTVNNNTTIHGLLRLVNNGRLITGTSAILRYTNQLPDLAGGTYEVTVSTITGNVTATRNEAFPQSLFVEQNGHLRLNGHKILTGSFGTYNGTLTMDNAADTLITNYAQFYGVSNLSAGTMMVRGDMQVSSAPPPAVSAWNLSGNHTTVFSGSQPQQFSFSDTTLANLNHVEIRNTQGVSVGTNTTIRGLLKLLNGGRLLSASSAIVKYANQLPDLSGGTYEVTISAITGNVTATRNEAFPTMLFVEGTGVLRLNGHKLLAAHFGTYNGTLRMDNPADTLWVGTASFYGTAQLYAGTLIVREDLVVSNPSGTGSWDLSAQHKTVFAGVVPQTVSFSDTTMAHLQHVEVSNTQGASFNSNTTIHGQLQLMSGGRLIAVNNAALKFTSRLPDISQGTYEVMQTHVTGNVTATANVMLPGYLFIASGNLTLGGRTVGVQGLNSVGGTVTMNNIADTLHVFGDAYVYGAANLSAGTLILDGDLVLSTYGPAGTAFNASGTHTTVFAGTAGQQLRYVDNNSHFANFKLENGAHLQVRGPGEQGFPADTVDIRGALIGVGTSTLESTYGVAARVAGGLDVTGMLLNRMTLDVAGALSRFDNVTFDNWSSEALLRIRNAGTGAAFSMNNIAFNMTPPAGRYWIEAEDTDAGTGAFTLDVVSPQFASGPTYTRALNGAVVGWRAPGPVGGN